ncbi:MAG: ribonuclease III [Desulfuromonadaceae bacterium]|nr:ribonuclease III [Desulfuromonadaceae bacterium]
MDITSAIAALQERLDYRFNDSMLLKTALTHKSFRNEQPADMAPDDNERLEFLGDAVLDLFIGERLYEIEPSLSEGEMTRVRAELVSEVGLARVSRTLQLGESLLLGRGERKSGGPDKDSLQANTLEAVIGAIFRDGGWQALTTVAARLFLPLIIDSVAQSADSVDSKSRLQELLQAQGEKPPEYRLIEIEGPDHDRRYGIEVLIDGQRAGFGSGRSKKLAQQVAAREALLTVQKLRDA